ncbi:MAG: hypothetical protein H0U98_10980 [Alphaproteobacteria bacterium]|nr:hypothetical protein [Alphaproteobacteria bacterium]
MIKLWVDNSQDEAVQLLWPKDGDHRPAAEFQQPKQALNYDGDEIGGMKQRTASDHAAYTS